MRARFPARVVRLIASITALSWPAFAATGSGTGFRIVAIIPLPGVEGRIDHLAYDADSDTVFIAALGNHTIEAVNVTTRRVERSLTGFGDPQGVAYSPALRRLYVASADGRVQSFRRDDLSVDRSVEVGADADNVRIDDAAQRLYVGHGDGAIAVLDTRTLARIADIPLHGHPESFQLVPRDARLLANVPGANQIALVDRDRATQIGQWPNDAAREANYPLAIDPTHGRAIAVFRKPARIVSYDLARGSVVVDAAACGCGRRVHRRAPPPGLRDLRRRHGRCAHESRAPENHETAHDGRGAHRPVPRGCRSPVRRRARQRQQHGGALGAGANAMTLPATPRDSETEPGSRNR